MTRATYMYNNMLALLIIISYSTGVYEYIHIQSCLSQGDYSSVFITKTCEFTIR